MDLRAGRSASEEHAKFLHSVISTLCLAVDRQTQLGQVVDNDGLTLFDHLDRARKAYGIDHPLLEPVRIPACATWVHEQFCRLSRRRARMTEHGAPMPLTYAEIETLERLNRIQFTQFDLVAIEAMDVAFLKAASTRTRG